MYDKKGIIDCTERMTALCTVYCCVVDRQWQSKYKML